VTGAVIATTLAFAALFAAQLSIGVRPGDGILLLYVLPVTIAGVVLGMHAGTAACITALILCAAWDLASEADIRASAYAAGAVVFTVAGPLLGSLVDAVREAVRRERITERAFEDAEERLSRGFDLKEGLALIDTLTPAHRLPRINSTLAELSGYVRVDLAGLGFWDLLAPRGETSHEDLERLLTDEASAGPLEAAIRHRDGSRVACTLSRADERWRATGRYVMLHVEAAHVPKSKDGSGDTEGLTARECEILKLVAEGRSGPNIARELHVSPETVKSHLKSIYRKLDVADRASAVAMALRSNLIE
jgi:PAS domain S-box-containing protein